jgi:transposase InsO family protein
MSWKNTQQNSFADSLVIEQVVGWALSKQPNTQLARDALSNVISRHQPNANTLMFHSLIAQFLSF